MKKRRCKKASGNGAKYYTCTVNDRNCPYQWWCTRDRIFKFNSDVTKCPNFEENI